MAATKGSQEGTQEGISTPMRCAILGGGTFAQNTYVPILEGDLWKFSKIAVDAVWSRSEETAKTLSLSMWHNKAEVHFGDAGLDAIIGSDSIEAVFIVLPPRPALEITLRCLRAGKHVLGEKPVGTNVEEIEAAIREHVGLGQWRPIWGIAENYRFEETYEFVSKIVAGLGGVITLSLNASCALSDSSPYWHTPWRHSTVELPEVDGIGIGYLFEGPVHFMAAIRKILGQEACSGARVTASATLMQQNRELKQHDTISGFLRFDTDAGSSCACAVNICYAAYKPRVQFVITCRRGNIVIERVPGKYVISGDGVEPLMHEIPFNGVDREISYFIDAVRKHKGREAPVEDLEGECSAREALLDVQHLLALFRSASTSQVVTL